MASQVTSGYSTEGTQYAQNNSFYLLDTVPGAGAALPGPITVAGNLTVTGTTVSQGAASALSLNTNTITGGPIAITSAAGSNITVTAPTTGTVTLAGDSVLMNAASSAQVTSPVAVLVQATPYGTLGLGPSILGSATVNLNANSGNLSINSVAGSATLSATVGNVILTSPSQVTTTCGNQIVNVLGNGLAASSGYGVDVIGAARLRNGVAVGPGMGTFAAPAAATPAGSGHTFQMLANKAFITTGGATTTLIVTLPGAGNNFIVSVGSVGATAQNVALVVQNGDIVTLTPTNPANPIVVSILAL